MSELASTLPWIAASVIVLVALVIGMGLALHFQTRLPAFAQPAIGVLQTAIPPIGLFLVGRNLTLKNLDFYQAINPQGLAAWIQRVGTALMVGLAVAVIIVKLLDRNDKPVPPGRMLIVAFLIYYGTNVLINSYFGTVPGIIAPYFYTAIVAVGLMMTRDQGYANLLIAYRWALTALMVASLALIPVLPNLVIQSNSLEVRLPFVTYRLFGLGSGPNSIGPLAALLILLAIDKPFRSRLLQLICLGSAIGVFVLAQSQTAWIAMALILPPYLVYRWLTGEKDGHRRSLSPSLVFGTIGMGLASLFAVSLFFVDWQLIFNTVAGIAGLGGDGLTNRSISGRGAIWTVAIDTFKENPLFGYGLTAWDSAFRSKLNMPFAFHAHNQLMQSLSVGGLLGVAGLLFYLGVLSYFSLRYARLSRGLAPALLTLVLIRCISEVPLDLLVALTGDFTIHLALLMVLAGSAALEGRPARARAPAGGYDWRAAPGGRTLAPARSIAVDPAAGDDQVVGSILRYGGRDRGDPRGPGRQLGFDGPGGPNGPGGPDRPNDSDGSHGQNGPYGPDGGLAGPASPIGPIGPQGPRPLGPVPGAPSGAAAGLSAMGGIAAGSGRSLPSEDGPVEPAPMQATELNAEAAGRQEPPPEPDADGRIEPRISDL